LRLADEFCDLEGAAQTVVNAGTAGQQGLTGRSAVSALCPVYFAAGRLEFEYEGDGVPHRGPHPKQERVVSGNEVVMPDPDRDVGAEVGVGRGIRHRRLDDL